MKNIGLIISYGIVLGLIILIGFMSYWRNRKRWKPLPRCNIPNIRIEATFTGDAETLTAALNFAYNVLLICGPWPHDYLISALTGTHIHFDADFNPTLEYDCSIGSDAFRRARGVYYGRGEIDLCHKLIHIAELQIEGYADIRHRSWSARGFDNAIRAYANCVAHISSK